MEEHPPKTFRITNIRISGCRVPVVTAPARFLLLAELSSNVVLPDAGAFLLKGPPQLEGLPASL